MSIPFLVRQTTILSATTGMRKGSDNMDNNNKVFSCVNSSTAKLGQGHEDIF